MSSSLGHGSKHAEYFYKTDATVASLETFQKILDSVEVDLSDFCEGMGYLGFDKVKIAKLAAKNLGAFLTVKFCMLGAMRGTNLEKILGKSVKVDNDVKEAHEQGKISSKVKGPDTLTVGRLLSTFPEIAAHYMLKQKVSAKLGANACPAALQFPSAAGLPMNHTIRLQHLEFAVQFSFLISEDKKFHPVYYAAAFNGQVDPGRLSDQVKELVGSPTITESKAVDLDKMIKGMMTKYGEDRFNLKNYK